MAVPARPTSGAPIDSTWGGIAHDAAVAQDIQVGNTTVSLSASTQGSTVVTFARPFASTPSVVAMLASGAGGSLGLITQASAITPTSVTLRLTSPTSVTVAGTPVFWIAIGPRA